MRDDADDEVLARRAADGDNGALDALLRNHITLVHSVCRKILGNPDDALARIQDLQAKSGGFGGLLQLAHNWADFPQTLRSYELIARYVAPRVNQLNLTRDQSMAWTAANRDELIGAAKDAKVLAAQKYSEEKQQRGS